MCTVLLPPGDNPIAVKYIIIIITPFIRTYGIDVSKDVRIRSYVSKPKGVCEQKISGNTGLHLSKVKEICGVGSEL
jgi:hypothetical protein